MTVIHGSTREAVTQQHCCFRNAERQQIRAEAECACWTMTHWEVFSINLYF